MPYKLISLLIFLLFTLFLNVSVSQVSNKQDQKKVDSLSFLLQNKTSDTIRVNRLNQLAMMLTERKRYDQALVLAQESKALSDKLNFNSGKIVSHIIIGDVFKNQGEIELGISYLNKALKIAKKSQDLYQEAYVYDQLGLANWTKGDTIASLNNHRQSLHIREKINNPFRQAQSNGNIAEIYSAQGKMKEAIAYYEASLNSYKQLNQPFMVAWSAGNVGLMNYWLGNTVDALKYFILALDKYVEIDNNDGVIWISSQISNIYKSIDDFENALKYANKVHQIHIQTGEEIGIAEANSLKAGIYFEMRDYQKSKRTYEQTLEIYSRHQDSLGIMNSLFYLGKVHLELKDYDASYRSAKGSLEIASNLNQYRTASQCQLIIGAVYAEKGETVKARAWFEKAFSFLKKSESTSNLPFVYKYLVKLDSLDGDFKSAFENYKRYIQYLELQEAGNTDTEKIAMRYEFEKKQAIAEANLKNQRTQRNAAIFGLLLSTILVVVLFYFFRLRNKKVKIEKEKLELQKREIDRIKESEQFKSRFLTNVTHEFRTPLTLIKAHLEVLKEKGRDEDQQRFQEMDSSGSRLLQLINQLLDLSKMESGEYKLKYRSGNVVLESMALVQAFQSLADQRQVKLVVQKEIKEDVLNDDFVYSQEALAIIISNLLSNSCKYTPAGGSIEVDILVSDPNTLIIKVKDTGKGILEAYLPHVFDRFYQVDNPAQRTYEGSGIGLSLVKELVLIHGGSVSVESPKKGGCTFTVILKSATDHQQLTISEKEIESIRDQPVAIADQLIDQKESELPLILVVEDQTELRRFITNNLGSEFRFAEAVNGKEGIQLAEELVPDLIISDVMMPEIGGLELCRHLKDNRATSHIPIILLTARVDEADKLAGLEIGANDYLTKPFSLVEIKLRVKNLLRLRQLIQKKFEGIDSSGQDKFSELSFRDKEYIENIDQVIQANISSNQFGVQELAESLFLSTSQFNRKMKSITGKTSSEYIRDFKLQKAIEILKEGIPVAEAGSEIGFEDPVYFSKMFKKHVGYPPSEVRK